MKFDDSQIDRGIILWAFRDAPEHFRDLSGHGGDEDFVAFVPASMVDTPLACDVERMAICDCETHEVEGGVVLIGAHA